MIIGPVPTSRQSLFIPSFAKPQDKFESLKNIVGGTMEELVGPTIWQEHKERCVEKLYEKYMMDEDMRRTKGSYPKI